MDWSKVGTFISGNAGKGVALVGSLLTGNIPGAIAAGVSMVQSATGASTPEGAISELQNNPEAMLKLKELYYANEESVREHLATMEQARLEDAQKEHEQTQTTIRGGDVATDEYVRRTRPMMARQSWYATIGYVIGFEGAKALGVFSVGATMELALILIAPASAYLGLRTVDKIRGLNK